MPWKNDQVSSKETDKIIELATKCTRLDGDFVEFGCYEGDTSLRLAELLSSKRLYLYDSFEGLPEKTKKDASALGEDFKKGELFASKKDLKARFLRSGLPVPTIKKAWFKDLKPEDLPEKIAFAFLDGDLYESIRDSLGLVTPKLIKNAIIIIHDYNNPALPGVAKAVGEWRNSSEKLQNLKSEVFQSMLIIHHE